MARSRSFRIAHDRGLLPPVTHRIETPDYSVSKRLAYRASRFLTGLLGEASVELDEQVSLHPALRANRMMRGEVIPLAELVRSGLPGAVVCRSPFRLSPLSR